MAHQKLLYPVPEHGRLIIIDSFYTTHTLTQQLNSLIDNKCMVLETVCFNNVDGINVPELKDATVALKHASCGAWHLVQVYQLA